MALLQLSMPCPTWKNHPFPPPSSPSSFVSTVTRAALTKQGHRLISSLAAQDDAAAAHRLIRKFVASSSKSVALNALTHLLSSDVHHYSSLALPMYERITEAHWFNWDSKLVSNVIASLEKQERFDLAETLVSETVQKLAVRERDLALFYCDLIDSCSKFGLKQRVFDTYARLKELLSGFSSSPFSMKRRGYESMIHGLCVLGLPQNGEEVMEEMRLEGFKPSAFLYRLIVFGYGDLGLLSDMTRVVDLMENSGYKLNAMCFNIVLHSYGAQGELSEMVMWIQKMKDSSIPFSIRTYNSVLSSCPTINTLLREPELLPLSIEELMEKLTKGEDLLVRELMGTQVLAEILEWSSSEGKLDMHGMNLGTAYVMILQWMEELRSRFRGGDSVVIPEEIMVVCGLGKHSKVRGKSPVKDLVSTMMVRLEMPMRIGRRKDGTFVGRGKTVKSWLLS